MMRSSVDFPEPERPSNPTISPCFTVRFTSSSTSNSLPPARGKARRTFFRSRSASMFVSSRQTIFAFGIPIERPPENTIDDADQQRHDGGAQNDAMKIAGHAGALDVIAKAVCVQRGSSPAHEFRHDGRVPRS